MNTGSIVNSVEYSRPHRARTVRTLRHASSVRPENRRPLRAHHSEVRPRSIKGAELRGPDPIRLRCSTDIPGSLPAHKGTDIPSLFRLHSESTDIPDSLPACKARIFLASFRFTKRHGNFRLFRLYPNHTHISCINLAAKPSGYNSVASKPSASATVNSVFLCWVSSGFVLILFCFFM